MADSSLARLRKLFESAQALITDLRGMGLEQPTRVTFPRVFELARIINRLQTAANSLPDGDTAAQAAKASWQQRVSWLQEDTAALAHERVYVSDPKEAGSRLLALLCTGADACDRVLREKAEVEFALSAARKQIADQAAQLTGLQAVQAEAHAASHQALEARAEATVLSQQLASTGEQLAVRERHIQALEDECARLRTALGEAQAAAAEATELADSRVTVIQSLMSRAEEQAGAVAEVHVLRSEVEALRGTLDANTRVVDKLLGLNEELMANLNAHAAAAARVAAAAAVTQPGEVAGPEAQADGQQGDSMQLPPSVGPVPRATPQVPGSMEGASGVAGVTQTSGPPAHRSSGPGPPGPQGKGGAGQTGSFAHAFSRFVNDE